MCQSKDRRPQKKQFYRNQAMIEKLKKIYLKTDFDLSQKNIHTYDFHPIIGIGLVANGITFKNKESKFRMILPLALIPFTVIGITMMCINIYHCWTVNDISEFSESFSYAMVANIMLIQQFWVLIKYEVYFELIDAMDRDFKEMDEAAEDIRYVFFENQLKIWKITVLWTILMLSIVIVYMLGTGLGIAYQYLFQEYYIGQRKIFIYKIWLPYDDVNRTPVYELFLSIEHVVTYASFHIFGLYICLLIQFISHPIGQLEIISQSFKNIFDFSDLEKNEIKPGKIEKRRVLSERIGDIVQRHSRVYAYFGELASLFGPPLLFQIFITPMLLCITAFQVSKDLEDGNFNLLFFFFFWVVAVQLYIPCFLGSMLMDKASEIGDACYSCGWENNDMSSAIGKDLVIFITRANRILTVNAFGLATMSMETYSSVLSTTASYFTMLRQLNAEAEKT